MAETHDIIGVDMARATAGAGGHWRSMMIEDTMLVYSRLTLQELLAIEGFDLTQPYRIRDLGHGAHQVSQDSIPPRDCLPHGDAHGQS